jgi:hypothetical protein
MLRKMALPLEVHSPSKRALPRLTLGGAMDGAELCFGAPWAVVMVRQASNKPTPEAVAAHFTYEKPDIPSKV